MSWSHARAELSRLGPVIGFLAAVLVLAEACDEEGVFRAAGDVVSRLGRGSPRRLLTGVVGLAAVSTAVLSLDTTVVLVTPVVLVAAARARVRPAAYGYASGHLANSASLLLPVSNLTNLLAVAVVPITVARFAALMALPWVVAVVLDLVALRLVFRADLRSDGVVEAVPPPRFPRFAVWVLAATLAGFVVTSALGVAPAWAAAGGALVIVVYRLRLSRTSVVRAVRAASPSFLVLVLGLGVVVRAASDSGLRVAVEHVLPAGSSLPALLAVAAVSAVAANLLNNLPATLLLLPVAAQGGVLPVLAVLVGVDVGPNLTYVGSLSTLLWRAIVRDMCDLGTWTRLALVSVPVTLLASTTALWLAARVVGT